MESKKQSRNGLVNTENKLVAARGAKGERMNKIGEGD